MIEVFNESDREAMMAVADVHISGVLPQENGAYVAKVREVLEVGEPALRTRMEAIRAADPDP